MRFSFPLLIPLCLTAWCASSVFAPSAFALPERLEGTISLAQNGVTQRAALQWQSPDHLRIEIPRDEVTGAVAQVVVAAGDDTQIFEPGTRRWRHLGFNIATKWWRGWGLAAGGPANFVFMGAKPGTVKDDEGGFLRRDKVMFGGGGKSGYYAAWKYPARRWAREVTTTTNSRLEKDDAGRETVQASLQLDGELPKTATLVARGASATFAYDLHARDAAFEATTWTLPDAAKSVLEDDIVLAPGDYKGTEPASLYNRAIALWGGAEDIPAAINTLEAVHQAVPEASAPALALYEVALSVRDFPRAARALDDLKAAGVDAENIEARRARLLVARRDYDGALAALDAQIAAAPPAWNARLRRATLLRIGGKLGAARAIWMEMMANADAPVTFRITAADAYSQFAAPDEWKTLRNAVAGNSEAEQLAKSVLGLRLNEIPEAPKWSGNEARVVWAQSVERAGQDALALAAWNDLEQNGDAGQQNRARAHKITLAARRGDTVASLDALRVWNATLDSSDARDLARVVLFDAWQKASKQGPLESAVANRASATGATNVDLQLGLAYQDLYGDSESVKQIVETGVIRYPDDSFWKSKQAEGLAGRAFPISLIDNNGRTLRASLFRQAFEALDKAIQTSPDQPFYIQQRALLAAQRDARRTNADAETSSFETKFAQDAIKKLLAAFPTDPDVQMCAAVSLFAFGSTADLDTVVQLANAAIYSTLGDGDRHVMVAAGRQTLAGVYEKLNRPQDAAAQYDALIAGARTARDQARLVGAYLGLIERKPPETAVDAAALLVARVAAEGWDSAPAREALDAVARRVAVSKLDANKIAAALKAQNTPGSILAWATISQIRLERAKAALAVPGAPAKADAELDYATRDLNASAGILRKVADGKDPMMAGRAAAFLAQRAGLSPEEGLTYLRRAVALEPTDSALRLALAETLGDLDEGKVQRRLASQTLDFNLESQRLLSFLYWGATDDPAALALSKETLNIAAHAPEFSANDYQRVAFARARIAWTLGKQAEATELYKGLASKQWLPLDRAAALIAWKSRLVEDGQAEGAAVNPQIAVLDQQIELLQIDEKGLAKVANFVDEVEN